MFAVEALSALVLRFDLDLGICQHSDHDKLLSRLVHTHIYIYVHAYLLLLRDPEINHPVLLG